MNAEPLTVPRNGARRGRKSALDVIVKAAAECFKESGLEGTSMSDIAARADVSRQAIYGHFKNKYEIFAHIMGMYIDSTLDRVVSRADLKQSPAAVLSASFTLMSRYSRTPFGRVLFDPRNRANAVRISQHLDSTSKTNSRLWRPIIDGISKHAVRRVEYSDAFSCLNYLLLGFLTAPGVGGGAGIAGSVAASYIFGDLPVEPSVRKI